MQTGMTSIHKYFQDITDPRVKNRSTHLFMEILVIALLATLAGAENFNDIALFAKSKEAWLCKFLALPGGIPSHDTFNRVFSSILPEEFSKCFIAWTQALAQKIEGVVAIDGKTLRSSFDSVRRGKARSFSGFNPHPATFAPAGSNRSSRGGNEAAEAFDVEGHLVTRRVCRP